MNLKETIRRILMEENQIPRNIMRRIYFSDFSPLMIKNSLRFCKENVDFDLSIESGAEFTARDLIPFHDENGQDYSDVDYEKWVKSLKNYLIETFGNETKEYLEKVFSPDVFQDDGYSYAIWKHADRNGGAGFTESYKTWGDLLISRSFWFPIEWWEIKSKLDKMDKGTLLILKPGDEFNNMGYYFSIIKAKKNLRESIKKILSEEMKIEQSEIDRFTCEDCGDQDYNMYMINDDIWKKYGNKEFTLCKSCLETRMDRQITKDDISQYKDALVNLYNPELNNLYESTKKPTNL